MLYHIIAASEDRIALSFCSGLLLNDRYRLTECLYQDGGIHQIWRAIDLQLQTPVVVKALDFGALHNAERRRVMQHEYNLMTQAAHLYVAQVYELMPGEDRFYFVMESFQADLLTFLGVHPSNPSWLLDAMIQVLGALEHGHALGMTHRDVKPRNIFVNFDGKNFTAKLGDFESAVCFDDRGNPAHSTDDLWFRGTPYYMSPEKLELYCMGALLGSYRMRFSMEAASDLYAVASVLKELSASQVFPPQFDEILRKAIEEDPGKRYATAAEFGRALQALL